MGTDDLFKKEKLKRETRKASAKKAALENILILCEGTKTEPNYFNSFICEYRLSNVHICGTGWNTDRITKEAIKQRNNYSQVWCVFDRDSFKPHNFNRAFQMVKKYQNIHIAYSNEAFELWYLLHFEPCNSAISRKQYIKKLDELLNEKYKKNSTTMYLKLKDKQQTAIKNAKKLLKTYKEENPEKNNPSTNVYELVELLNKYGNMD